MLRVLLRRDDGRRESFAVTAVSADLCELFSNALLLSVCFVFFSNAHRYEGEALLHPEPVWLKDDAPTSVVVDEILSDPWQQAVANVLDPEAHAIEEEEADFAQKARLFMFPFLFVYASFSLSLFLTHLVCVQVAVKWQRFLRELQQRVRRNREERATALQQLRAQADSTVQRHQQAEQQRLDLVHKRYTDFTRTAARAWRHTLRSVTNERGPWGIGDAETDASHWKLDRSEDGSRRRMRLRRNYDFNPHIGCAVDSHQDEEQQGADAASAAVAAAAQLQPRRSISAGWARQRPTTRCWLSVLTQRPAQATATTQPSRSGCVGGEREGAVCA